jgi:hypothetical protein
MKDMGSYALFTSYGLTYLYKADDELAEALESYDMDGMESKIMFVFGIKEDMYMDAVWARKGFGPIAYMVAMQMQGTMAPYWMESQVTPQAAKVWKEFFNGKGEKLVNKELTGVNPENYRHYWYSLKKPLRLNKNKKIDEKFIGPDKYGERRGMMDELAEGILRQSMRGIYNF